MTPKQLKQLISATRPEERKPFWRAATLAIFLQVLCLALVFTGTDAIPIWLVCEAIYIGIFFYLRHRFTIDPRLFMQIARSWAIIIGLAIGGTFLYLNPSILAGISTTGTTTAADYLFAQIFIPALLLLLIPVLWYETYKTVRSSLINLNIKGYKPDDIFA